VRDSKQLLAQVDAVRDRLDAHRPFTPDVEERVRAWLVPRFIYCSSALGAKEGLTATQTAAFLESQVVSGGHPIDRFLAVSRHQAALDLALERAGAGGVVDVELLRRFHRLLTQGGARGAQQRSGQFKAYASVKTRRRGHVFRYVAPSKVEECMAQLERELPTRLAEDHPVVAAAWLYFHFNMIQPFERGNGKVARLALATLLFNRGFPPLMVRPDDVGELLDVLAACDTSVTKEKFQPLSDAFDLTRLVEFLTQSLARTGERMLDVIEGRAATAEQFAERARASQEELAARLLDRKDVSWRFRATFEVRALHERCAETVRGLCMDGPLYEIVLDRAEAVPSHAARRPLAVELPGADAGLVGELEVSVRPNATTRGIKLPPPVTLILGVAATQVGLHVIVTGIDIEAQTHYGPARAPEWPTSTLDSILSRTLDEHRKRYEAEIDRLNASATERYRLLRETTDDEPAGAGEGDGEADEADASPRERLEAAALDGLRPAEPPLAF